MKDLVKQLLMALGFTATQIEDLEKDAPEGKKEDYLASVLEHQKKLLKNDAEFVGEIQRGEKGRVLSQNEAAIKKTFGLTAEEVKDKSFAEIVAIAQKKTLKNADATLEQVQQENLTLAQKLKDLEETEIPKIRGEVDNHKKKITTGFKLNNLTSEFELSVSKTAALNALSADLDAQYDIDLDDKGELKFLIKGTELVPKTKDNTKFLTPKEIIAGKFEEWQFLKKSNAGAEPPKTVATVRKEGEAAPKYAAKTNAGLNAAEENYKNMQKTSTP